MSTETATTAASSSKDHVVCLVGMPNSGKTTLMNALTGGNFKTANYAGVTVSLLRGRSKPEYGAPRNIVDLPGVNSSISPSPEEELAVEVIEGRHAKVRPDAFILVVDATQLERHLKFGGLVGRQGKPTVIALTMVDLLDRTGQSVNVLKLANALGIPVIPVDPRTGRGVKELLAALDGLGGLVWVGTTLSEVSSEPVVAFKQIHELLRRSGAVTREAQPDSVTSRIDRFVLHRYIGFPVFFLVLISLFAAIFWLAQPFMDFIDNAFAFAASSVTALAPDSVVMRFLGDGVIAGVGAVAVFFPQIMILFFLMTLLEDSGYLARGATLVDRPLSWLGLHGRSFVPMLSGFACAIPAVFAARAIPARRERLLTIWILPLMSCSARLPVYALLLAALLPAAAWQAGLSLAAIYVSSLLIGSLIAGLTARLVMKHRQPSLLAMELPAYRVPRWWPILRMTWARGSSYLKRAGVPILIVSAILWVISNFGYVPGAPVAATSMEESFASNLGQTIEPALRPMGVDWRVGVGLISAFAAREVFVSSMAIVFHVDSDDEQTQQQGLIKEMNTATFPGTGQRIFTTASIIGLVVFFFFSLQCFSTVAVVRKEMNSWKLAALQLLFYTGLGYTLAVLTVQTLRAFGVD
ncbi:MAG TPA: ferrous iron transporter B [Terriglobia bacterium]|nr:ferrous iron transporter B [Terriglobia bacterium]